MSCRFSLTLDTRLEYLTLAVGNAKSHPVSVGGRHETAIAFLTDLEEKLDVAQVQLELYNTLLPRQHEPEVAERFKALSNRLYNITEVRTVLSIATAVHSWRDYHAAVSIICGSSRSTADQVAHLARFGPPRREHRPPHLEQNI